MEDIEIIETLELEEHSRRLGCEAPAAKHYAFRVDKQRVVVSVPRISGSQILAEVGKTAAEFKLYQHKRSHQPIQIGPHEVVNLREPGVERFTTMPKDTTEGLHETTLSRNFLLPKSDEEYLEGIGLDWETIVEQRSRWLLIHGWTLPRGYNYSTTSLALLIPDNYSDSQIDMVYFEEQLARSDGRPIGALSVQTIRGATWQRWSRHRTPQNAWRIGVDDISTHLSLVDEWLCREFEKAA